jgi:hypothetical protein
MGNGSMKISTARSHYLARTNVDTAHKVALKTEASMYSDISMQQNVEIQYTEKIVYAEVICRACKLVIVL